MEGNLLERLDDAVSQLSTVLAEPSKILATMREARKEIEHLRSLAGSVSQGQTFAQIRETTGGVVLKAFDGA